MDTPRSAKPRILTSILIGATYGILLRVGFEFTVIHPYIKIISTAFLLACPVSVGAIAVLMEASKEKISVKRQLAVSFSSMALFLVAMFVTLLEGLICIVLVAPVFLIAALIGGLLAGYIHNTFRIRKGSLSAFALVPILMAPLEGALPPKQSEQLVTNSIHIAAPPEKVFATLTNVRDIQADELGFTFVHLIGLPKPIEAHMDSTGVGSVRTSRWEKQVWFQEVTTVWHPPYALHYRFHIPKGGIPREALDQHVEIGGEYFDLINGGYDLEPTADGGTRLSLHTRFVNKSSLELYGNIWGRMVLADFHHSILGLMKHRAERAIHTASQPG
ncbi:hypothetical protein ACTSKR_12590 [Chitinibacteraceae bacterium HSL-7]